jgi:hypothetical protein
MRSFKDKANRNWEFEIDFLTVDRLRTTTPFDLLDHEKAIKLAQDSVELYKLMWALAEEQAGKHNVTALDFAKLLRPVFKEARDALLSEISDFFQSCQSPDKALAVEEMRLATMAAAQQFEAMAATEAEAIRSKRDALIQTKLQNTFGGLGASLDKMLSEEVARSASSGMPPQGQGSA